MLFHHFAVQVKILDGLDSFRGESRFTTWAQKIAVRVAFTELRRHRWRDVSLDEMTGSPEADPSTALRRGPSTGSGRSSGQGSGHGPSTALRRGSGQGSGHG
ncbi:MAG: hypothetical protein OEW09_06480, partial [Anaerolineae bacterium]|nr:hypothetical protein [Anaerolineae bacterium]